MALVVKDRVRETSTSTGTGAFTLNGAVAGFQSFSAIGTGNQTYYTIVNGTTEWEVGIGTWTSPNQLSRGFLASSTGSAVNFTAGTKDVFVTFPAEGFGRPPAIGDITPNTITGTTITGNTVRSYGRFTVDDTGTSGYTAELGVDANGYAVIGGASSVGGTIIQAILAPAGLQLGDSNTAVLTLNAAPTVSYGLNFPPTAGSANQVLKTDGTGVTSWTDKFILGAGTATAGTAPLKFTSGTNLTTAEAGAIEYNGTAMFSTGTSASGRGINLSPQMVRLNADRTKPNNDTTLEAIFDSANDALALAANTLYYFKGVLYFTKTASATSSTITLGFIFSNTQQDIAYGICANSVSVTTNIRSVIAGATNTTSSLSTNAFQQTAFIEGFFKSNATTGGTVTPTFAQSVAGTTTAPSALAGSFIMIQPISSDPNATLIAGNWS